MTIDAIAHFSLFMVVISWGWHIIGLPPIKYLNRRRRIEAVAGRLLAALDEETDDEGYVSGTPEEVAYAVAARLDGTLKVW